MAQPAGLTEDGYEIQFGSNYMGPALFTRLLLPVLRSTAERPSSDVRVINLSSELFKQAPPEGLLLSKTKSDLSEVGSVARYGQSKLADYYHTTTMARQYPDIKFVAVHPGVVNTGLFDDFRKRRPYVGAVVSALSSLFLTGVEQGAIAQLWTSTAPTHDVRSGGFYNPSLKEYRHALLTNEKLAQELEEWTEAEFRGQGF
ncbi:NAD(P)-binding protein [Hortaea werneckii]|nr:NAD(P)-binding protein [Hortaea werneckii]